MIHASCSFIPIGQGCFYTAAIGRDWNDPSQHFRLVYDCGTSNGASFIEPFCEDFAESSRSELLHAIVISHFDADHVNGLDALLSRFTQVRQVFIPYMSPVERLICALRFADEPAVYYEFLADPVLYLQSRGANQVTIVGGGGHEEDEGDIGGSDSPPDAPFSEGKIGGGQHDDEGEEKFKEEGSTAETPNFITDKRPLFLFLEWKFRFFNERRHDFDLSSVKKCDDFLALPPSNEKIRRTQDFLSTVKAIAKGFDTKSMTHAIRYEKTRKELREAYQAIRSVHNEVSLVLWHGPAASNPLDVDTTVSGWDIRGLYEAYLSDGGTLITGDITLTTTTLDRFEGHFRRELPRTGVFYLPHHGSWHSFEFDGSIPDSDCAIVVSAGRSNSYGHPNRMLLRQVRRSGKPVFWSREGRGIDIFIVVLP